MEGLGAVGSGCVAEGVGGAGSNVALGGMGLGVGGVIPAVGRLQASSEAASAARQAASGVGRCLVEYPVAARIAGVMVPQLGGGHAGVSFVWPVPEGAIPPRAGRRRA